MSNNSNSNTSNINRHSENVDTWSHITSNLLHLWIQDKHINVRNYCGAAAVATAEINNNKN